MKRISLLLLLVSSGLFAQIESEDHHEHVGKTNLMLNYELLDFKNSRQKDDGRRYGVQIDHQNRVHHLQLYIEHTDTSTKPVVPEDLSVNKYAFRYQYAFERQKSLSLSYLRISDNLMKEVDGGDIYGIGYRYKALSFTQYFSDYSHFNVYQSDLKWVMKQKFGEVMLMGAIEGKYILLRDRKSNPFSAKAKKSYTTLGLKAHAHYQGWHLGGGFYVGERIFAVMNDGLSVQHHAMAFKYSYMFGVGRELGDDLMLHLRYAKHKATEVPVENEGVYIKNIGLELKYRF